MYKMLEKIKILLFIGLVNLFLLSNPYYTHSEECGSSSLVTIQTAWRSGIAIDNADNFHTAQVNFFNNSMNLYYNKIIKSGDTVVNELLITNVSNTVDLQEPSVTSDNLGNANIVWADNRDGNFELYFSRIDTLGNILVSEKRLTFNSSTSWMPSTVIDSMGAIHITWIEDRDGQTEIYYKKIDIGGNELISDIRLTNASGLKNFLSSKIDSSDNIHLVWTDKRGLSNEIYYLMINTFGNVLVNDKPLTASKSNNVRPHLTIDATGFVHTVWSGDRTGTWAVYYARLDNNGLKLAADTVMSDPAMPSGDPDITHGAGNIYITFSGSVAGKSDIYYIILDINGNVIAPGKQISAGMASSWAPSTVADSNGQPHFIWLDGHMMANKTYSKVVAAAGGGYNSKEEKRNVVKSLEIIKNTLNGKLKKYIEKAVLYIESSLNDTLWLDSCRLVEESGKTVFKQTVKAFKYLDEAIEKLEEDEEDENDDDKKLNNIVEKVVLVTQIIKLYETDRAILKQSIADAKNNNGDIELIIKAEKLLLKAENYISLNKYKKAAKSLKKAWKGAVKAW